MGNYCNNTNENNYEFNPYNNQNLTNNNNANNTNDYCNKCWCYLQNKLCDDSNSISFMTYIFGETELEKRIKKEKITKLKTNVLNRQKNLRSKKKEISENDNLENNNIITNQIEKEDTNKKVNQVLEDMCIYGYIMKEEIKEQKKNNPEKFIEVNDALNLEQEDQQLFALGLIGNNLQNSGIEVAIEKNESNDNEENKDEDDLDAGTTCLEFITNEMNQKKKYSLHFDFGKQKNEEYLNDEEKFEELKEQLKEKISKDYNISKETIIITLPQRGSLRVQIIFQSNEFNDLDIEDFKSKFQNDNEFSELQNLKEIHTDVIMQACKLKKSQLDSRGNRIDGWGVDEERGNKPYNPPLGWTGIGLNVLDKYDNGDNTWIGMSNIEGEWCVAYHGVGCGQNSESVKKVTGLIIGNTFKKGFGQLHSLCDDQYHPGQKVGEGVYCTPNIETAERYAGISKINNDSYKTVLMVRVKPKAIRGCLDSGDYWVVNGTTDEIRPYRILYKKI